MDDSQTRERRLTEALGALVQQIDIGDYRDSLGHPAKNNVAFVHAQALVDELGVTHEDICRVLRTCGEDLSRAARMLGEQAADRAQPGSTPPEYQTWRTGP